MPGAPAEGAANNDQLLLQALQSLEATWQKIFAAGSKRQQHNAAHARVKGQLRAELVTVCRERDHLTDQNALLQARVSEASKAAAAFDLQLDSLTREMDDTKRMLLEQKKMSEELSAKAQSLSSELSACQVRVGAG
eukprot:jgi/Botrbrau1/5233/Bobra.0172s0095.2